jgi:hypothetical protein
VQGSLRVTSKADRQHAYHQEVPEPQPQLVVLVCPAVPSIIIKAAI